MDSYQDRAETGKRAVQNVTVSRVADPQQNTAISSQQQKTIELIAEGKTILACAQAVSVSRNTIYRWFKEPHFIAAYNNWRAQAQAEARGRMLALLNPALDALAKGLGNGDLKAATLILKSLGLLQPIPPGPQDVEAIAAEAHTAEIKRQQARQSEIFDSIGLDLFAET